MQRQHAPSSQYETEHWADKVGNHVLLRQGLGRRAPDPFRCAINDELRSVVVGKAEKLTTAQLRQLKCRFPMSAARCRRIDALTRQFERILNPRRGWTNGNLDPV